MTIDEIEKYIIERDQGNMLAVPFTQARMLEVLGPVVWLANSESSPLPNFQTSITNICKYTTFCCCSDVVEALLKCAKYVFS